MARSFSLVVCALLLASGYVVVRYRHGAELRAAAANTRTWNSRNRELQPSADALARLPELPRSMVHSVCFEEGGDTLGRHNCFEDATRWLLDTAEEQDERRSLGYVGFGLGGAIGVVGFMIGRRKQGPFA